MKSILRGAFVALALAVSGALVAPAAQAASGTACDEDSYSGAWLCAKVTVPSTVTLSKSKSVTMDVVVDYTASGDIDLSSGNWIIVTHESTGTRWTFDLDKVTSTRESVTLELQPGLVTGRFTVGVSSSAWVEYYDDFGWDEDYLWVYETAVTSFTVKAATTKKAQKTYMKLGASAPKVAYNKKVTLKGSVTYGSSRKALKGKTLTVYFDPDGALPKKKVGTVKTNSKGQFSKSFRQKVPGTWTVTWKGNSSYKKVSRSVSTTVKPHKYSSCAKLNKDYPGGVAKSSSAAWKHGEDHEPLVFKALYTKNKHLDRDKDGVTCER
jgi:Excalibur calcium-binding domain.